MSKGSKKTAKTNAAASKKTAKRRTTVPVAQSAKVVKTTVRLKRPPAPTLAEPVVAGVVGPIETAPATIPAVAQPSAGEAVATPLEAAPAPTTDGQIGILIRDLRNPDADIAREAAAALGATGSAAAVDALIEVLENADGYYHSVVRSAAASSLAALGDKRAIASLLGAVNDTMAEASAEAVRALADLGDARAVDTLVSVVQNVTGFFQPVVRLAAVHALGRFDVPQAEAERAHVAADPTEDTVIRDAAGE
jgi:hypothetical protein